MEITKSEAPINFGTSNGSSIYSLNEEQKPFEDIVEIRCDKYILKKLSSTFCPDCSFCTRNPYKKKRLILYKDHLIYESYSEHDNQNINKVKIPYYLDKDMKVERDGENKLKLNNNSICLSIKFENFSKREQWIKEIEDREKNYESLIKNNVYKSFTNAKEHNLCNFFIDARDYYWDLYNELMAAETSIYITDYWLSPELFLLRPIKIKVYKNMEKNNIKTEHLGKETSKTRAY